MNEQTFYRKLFFRRYALLLQKVERTYGLSAEAVAAIRNQITNLDWVDVGVEKLRGGGRGVGQDNPRGAR
jgi:hypothetical protein